MHFGSSLLATHALFSGALCIQAAWPPFSFNFSENGQELAIPNWQLTPRSSTGVVTPSNLSYPGSGGLWYNVPVSRCTLIGCLIATATPPWDDVSRQFFADNMRREGKEMDSFHED